MAKDWQEPRTQGAPLNFYFELLQEALKISATVPFNKVIALTYVFLSSAKMMIRYLSSCDVQFYFTKYKENHNLIWNCVQNKTQNLSSVQESCWSSCL